MMQGIMVHNGIDCRVVIGRYKDTGNTSIKLNELSSGRKIIEATVNVVKLKPPFVAIRDSGKNLGVEWSLHNAGIIRTQVDVITVGNEYINVYQLTEYGISLYRD